MKLDFHIEEDGKKNSPLQRIVMTPTRTPTRTPTTGKAFQSPGSGKKLQDIKSIEESLQEDGNGAGGYSGLNEKKQNHDGYS